MVDKDKVWVVKTCIKDILYSKLRDTPPLLLLPSCSPCSLSAVSSPQPLSLSGFCPPCAGSRESPWSLATGDLGGVFYLDLLLGALWRSENDDNVVYQVGTGQWTGQCVGQDVETGSDRAIQSIRIAWQILVWSTDVHFQDLWSWLLLRCCIELPFLHESSLCELVLPFYVAIYWTGEIL